MTTDAYPPSPLLLAAIEYLEYNDFTEILVLGNRFLSAKDGTVVVLFWLEDQDWRLPRAILKTATSVHARVDVIMMKDGTLRHFQNAVEAT